MVRRARIQTKQNYPGPVGTRKRNITFTLVVDDFGVKYVAKADALHLIDALKQNYKITEDWSGRKYIRLTFDWDYEKRKVHLSMPGYVQKTLE